jgi:hypothetical protein
MATALNAPTDRLRRVIGGDMSQTSVSLAAAGEEPAAVSAQSQSGASDVARTVSGWPMWRRRPRRGPGPRSAPRTS